MHELNVLSKIADELRINLDYDNKLPQHQFSTRRLQHDGHVSDVFISDGYVSLNQLTTQSRKTNRSTTGITLVLMAKYTVAHTDMVLLR